MYILLYIRKTLFHIYLKIKKLLYEIMKNISFSDVFPQKTGIEHHCNSHTNKRGSPVIDTVTCFLSIHEDLSRHPKMMQYFENISKNLFFTTIKRLDFPLFCLESSHISLQIKFRETPINKLVCFELLTR